ncbi:hypothetical protein EMPG_14660 [Blastomyces silverae]|uniref:Uncharacterized protein n=1 Tax=Blastomyces silverae TaxID=2060906 RepID=A0A0H1BL89_9EURO|nr:hypothetical protein EMPG_14660 [Blastomyces silverae]
MDTFCKSPPMPRLFCIRELRRNNDRSQKFNSEQNFHSPTLYLNLGSSRMFYPTFHGNIFAKMSPNNHWKMASASWGLEWQDSLTAA